MSYNKIGYYQLNNLIENRVPFFFFNYGTDLTSWYTSMQKLHVEAWQVMLVESQTQSELDARKIPKDYALVLLCQDGVQSERIAHSLQNKGYTNVYLIDGGYQQMVTDKG